MDSDQYYEIIKEEYKNDQQMQDEDLVDMINASGTEKQRFLVSIDLVLALEALQQHNFEHKID